MIDFLLVFLSIVVFSNLFYHLHGGFFSGQPLFFLLNRCLCLTSVCNVSFNFLFLQFFCLAVRVCCI